MIIPLQSGTGGIEKVIPPHKKIISNKCEDCINKLTQIISWMLSMFCAFINFFEDFIFLEGVLSV